MAVLLSGSGRTLQNLANLAGAGDLAIEIPLVISSTPDVLGLERARNLGIPATTIVRKAFPSRDAFADAMWAEIRASGAELVCLAGYLSLLPIPDDYRWKVVNIHPALLPSFGGRGMFGHHVHEAVLAAGCKVTGCTVHFCDQAYDTGPIISQRTCPVFDDDTPDVLAARVFEQECLAYPEALQWLADGRVEVTPGRTTRIKG